jgi:hypothetical protein
MKFFLKNKKLLRLVKIFYYGLLNFNFFDFVMIRSVIDDEIVSGTSDVTDENFNEKLKRKRNVSILKTPSPNSSPMIISLISPCSSPVPNVKDKEEGEIEEKEEKKEIKEKRKKKPKKKILYDDSDGEDDSYFIPFSSKTMKNLCKKATTKEDLDEYEFLFLLHSLPRKSDITNEALEKLRHCSYNYDVKE